MAKSRRPFFYFVTTMTSITFSFLAMKLIVFLLPAVPVPQDWVWGGGIILSYVYVAKAIRAIFFPASANLIELLPKVSPFHAAALLFLIVLFIFPSVFIFISLMETINTGPVLAVGYLFEFFQRIFPVKDYLLLLLQAPIVALVAAIIYNRIPR